MRISHLIYFTATVYFPVPLSGEVTSLNVHLFMMQKSLLISLDSARKTGNRYSISFKNANTVSWGKIESVQF